ncbi:MAG: ankyrin repeat domain-containing protein [Alphaproteobacteria bacterium]
MIKRNSMELGSSADGQEEIDLPSHLKGSSLTFYAQKSHFYQVQATIRDFPRDFNCQDRFGMTALHWAAANRHHAMCQILLDTNALDLSIQDNRGRTALDHAISSGDTKVIQLIMQKMYGDD